MEKNPSMPPEVSNKRATNYFMLFPIIDLFDRRLERASITKKINPSNNLKKRGILKSLRNPVMSKFRLISHGYHSSCGEFYG
ncbi:MAG: hypothetical protein ACFFDN_10385 [Candidatus Hodarchaeota archaeon]